ncbi:MAG: hypothetical protein EZS28_053978, partial [Streblomastix strix]
MASKEFESVGCVGNQNPSVSQSSQIINMLYPTEITDSGRIKDAITPLYNYKKHTDGKKGSKT